MPANKENCVHSNPIVKAQHTWVFVLLSQIELAHTKIMRVSLFSQCMEVTLRLQEVLGHVASLFSQLAKTAEENNSKHGCTSNIFGATKRSCQQTV